MNLFVLFNIIVLIVFFFTIMALIMVLLKDSPKARFYAPISFGTALACFLVLIVGVIGVVVNESKLPVVVETISEPQIDTTITTVNGVRDTTYTYTFYNEVLE